MSEYLSKLWNDQATAEKAMLKGQKSDYERLRHKYVTKRNVFNKEVQRAKRQYVRQKQIDLDALQSHSQSTFWK